jgi:hypothetical protein
MTPAPEQLWRDRDGGTSVETIAVDDKTITVRRASGKVTKIKRARFEKAFLYLRDLAETPQ